ncbi:MAG: hypothetical protein H7288_08055 [Kineosporiaceae bacterium]|nr:hypothetical protein [Aeromicrobium sp.]
MYDVALLIEGQLNELDADQIVALHEGLDEPVTYHILLPVESSTAVLSSSLSALGAGQIIPPSEPDVLAEVQREIRTAGQAELEASGALLRARAKNVTEQLTEDDPINALIELVKKTSSAEAIILTEPHIVSEFLRLDWSARAQRKLDVPTLHLLEHVPFDAQR